MSEKEWRTFPHTPSGHIPHLSGTLPLHLLAMLGLNGTPSSQPLQLTGIPGMQTGQAWVALVFCTLYLLSIIGNLTILVLVIREPALTPAHVLLPLYASPMIWECPFLHFPPCPLPFCFNDRHVDFDACLAQMFFIHTFSFMESGILLAMSFDRFVAICDPLRYAAVLTNNRIWLWA